MYDDEKWMYEYSYNMPTSVDGCKQKADDYNFVLQM